jgi:hypothetical protein
MRTLFIIVLAFLTVSPLFGQRTAIQPPREPAVLSVEIALERSFEVRSASAVPLACSIGSVSCGTSRSGSLGAGGCTGGDYYFDFYQLQATAGQKVTVSAQVAGSRHFLIAIQRVSDGTVLASRDGLGSVTLEYTPPASGPIIVSFAFVERFGSGAYSFTISCQSLPGGCTPSGTLQCGTLQSGILQSTDCNYGGEYYADLYEIDVIDTSRAITVTATAGFPLYVEVYGPGQQEGTWVSGSSHEVLAFVPSRAGRHTIAISTGNERVQGPYTFTVECVPSSCRQRPARPR